MLLAAMIARIREDDVLISGIVPRPLVAVHVPDNSVRVWA